MCADRKGTIRDSRLGGDLHMPLFCISYNRTFVPTWRLFFFFFLNILCSNFQWFYLWGCLFKAPEIMRLIFYCHFIFCFDTKILPRIAYLRFKSTSVKPIPLTLGSFNLWTSYICLCSQWPPSAVNTVPVRVSPRLAHPVVLYLIPLIFQVQWCSAKVGSDAITWFIWILNL